jgi:hypothetical protein
MSEGLDAAAGDHVASALDVVDDELEPWSEPGPSR